MNKNLQEIFKTFKNIDKKILRITKYGLKYSFYFCILATLILITYKLLSVPILFYTGISLLKSGFFFIVAFTICGFAFDKILREV